MFHFLELVYIHRKKIKKNNNNKVNKKIIYLKWDGIYSSSKNSHKKIYNINMFNIIITITKESR